MSKQIVIIGASGHGKVIADIAEKNRYEKIVFLDDNIAVKNCGKYPVVGTSCDALLYSESDFIVGIGRSDVRMRLQDQLTEKGLHIVSLIHPNAVITESVAIGIGTVVMAGVVINSGAKIGSGCIINTCSSVDHDCIIEDYAHISVGAHIAGSVCVGKHTWIGAGATVINNIRITDDCMIGAGAVVVKNIEDKGIYKGIPARCE